MLCYAMLCYAMLCYNVTTQMLSRHERYTPIHTPSQSLYDTDGRGWEVRFVYTWSERMSGAGLRMVGRVSFAMGGAVGGKGATLQTDGN